MQHGLCTGASSPLHIETRRVFLLFFLNVRVLLPKDKKGDGSDHQLLHASFVIVVVGLIIFIIYTFLKVVRHATKYMHCGVHGIWVTLTKIHRIHYSSPGISNEGWAFTTRTAPCIWDRGPAHGGDGHFLPLKPAAL